MRSLLLLLLITVSFGSFCQQRTDTTWWKKNEQIQTIRKIDGRNVSVECWHPNGRPMTAGTFLLKNAYIPVSDITIWDANGDKVQAYKFAEGVLINYIAEGKTKDVLTSPIKDTVQQYYEYYTNGKVKTKQLYKKDTTGNGIYFFMPNHSKEIAFIYQQSVPGLLLREAFYPNGKLYYDMVFSSTKGSYGYKQQWYLPSGKVDTGAYVFQDKSGYGFKKQGKRLDWWNNGNLKLEETYINDAKDGAFRTWHDNGSLASEAFYKQGSEDGVTKLFYENGSLHYYKSHTPLHGDASLNFHPNGIVYSQETGITSIYDSLGNLQSENFSMGSYSRYFDFKNGKPNNNRYVGVFDKMRKGKWTAYDENDHVIYETNYNNGLSDGETIVYDTMGHLRAKINYTDGALDGPYLIMNANGLDTLSFGNYNTGRKFGVWKDFYTNGTLYEIQEYSEKSVQPIVKYDENGTLTLETVYDANGDRIQKEYNKGKVYMKYVKHANSKYMDSYSYFPNGQTKNTTIYNLDGSNLYSSWYQNGNKEAETFRLNDSVGKTTTWYANGNKRAEGNYEGGYLHGQWRYYDEKTGEVSISNYVKGVETILPAANDNCFCNRTYPSFGMRSFFNTSDYIMPAKSVNKLMHTFEIDKGSGLSFTRCTYCYPMELIFYQDLKVWIGNSGMYFNFTPCRHGHNYTLFKIANAKYEHMGSEYREIDDDSDLLVAPNLQEVFARLSTIAFNRYNNISLQDIMARVTKDEFAFNHFITKEYGVKMLNERIGIKEEQELLDKAKELYETKKGDYSKPGFYKDLGYKLADKMLAYFPGAARVLASKPTDRSAITTIAKALFEDVGLIGYLPKVFGSLEVVLDSGEVSLYMPVNIISRYNATEKNSYLSKGKPLPAMFNVSYNKAYFKTYPKDIFYIDDRNIYQKCANDFAIAQTGAWVKPIDFEFNFGKLISAENSTGLRDLYNYPAHATNVRVNSDMGVRATAEGDKYLNNFMGIHIKEGLMELPGIPAPFTIKEMLIDEKEINGTAIIPLKGGGINEAQLTNAFKLAGFKVFAANPNIVDKNAGYVVVYFNFVAPVLQ